MEILRDGSVKAQWLSLKSDIINVVPDRLKPVPYQVKSIAVRDACRAVSAAKRKSKAQGGFNSVDFRSRKHPKQGCFIPSSAIKPQGMYHTMLGPLKMAESLPEGHKDSRLTLHNGQYHLTVPAAAQRRIGETQARVVALDPGIRTFLTWFSETDAGKIGQRAFGRIQRLCHHLDDLLSRASKAPRWRKHRMYRAASRMRVRIRDLVAELHHQAARFLVDNFDLILLPTFETSDMARRAKRKLGSKTVRSMLTFAHYRFQQFLMAKAHECGKQVLLVNEAYTSKTCSWSGEIRHNLGGRHVIAGSDGVRLDRDTNGARGIFLRALGDHPILAASASGDALQPALVSVC